MSEYMFDPVELTVQWYLREVQDVQVTITRPEKLPERFVQVQAVGGNAALVSQRAMVTFICWGKSRADAMRFAETIRAHVRGCRELAGLPVYRVREIGGPTSRPDPETGRQRYQFTLELSVRGKQFAP